MNILKFKKIFLNSFGISSFDVDSTGSSNIFFNRKKELNRRSLSLAKCPLVKNSMTSFCIYLMAVIMTFVLSVSAAAVDLNIHESGLKILTVKDVDENFGRGLPMGPSSMRYAGDNLWVLDSVAGNIVEFDAEGKALRTIKVANADKLVFADFAFEKDQNGQISAIWAIGSEDTRLLKIDLTGKVLKEFGTQISMPCQLELINGRLLVAFDEGPKTISAWDLDGKLMWQQQAAGKRFLVSDNGELLFLGNDKEGLKVFNRNLETGESKALTAFPVSEDSFPSLLAVGKNNDLLFSFQINDEEGSEFLYQIGRASLGEAEMECLTFDFPAPFLNRVLVENHDKIMRIQFIENEGIRLLRVDEFDPGFSAGSSKG
ncbi:MAG: hypothetical protein ACOYXC_20965 [Candidatus Rifleibacteriota bacterium]